MPDALSRLAGEPILARRVRHVVTENTRVMKLVALLRAGRPAGIGPILTASHASLRDDFEVSAPELDTAVAAAIDAGALGARMTGGGFGGSAIARTPAAASAAVTAGVVSAATKARHPVPAIGPVLASAGARRDGTVSGSTDG